jgi:hypothetical protein
MYTTVLMVVFISIWGLCVLAYVSILGNIIYMSRRIIMPKLTANLFNIISTALKTFQGADGDSLVATGEASGAKGETAEIYSSPGIIGRPAKNTKGLRIRLGKIDIIVAVYNYTITPPENPGETKTFSTDAEGAEQAHINYLNDGTIEINGNDDFAVAFNDLKTGYDQLKSDFNSLVNTYNLHTHIVATTGTAVAQTGTAAATLATGTTSSASIDDSKVENVKLP